jgi:hypothetical protein
LEKLPALRKKNHFYNIINSLMYLALREQIFLYVKKVGKVGKVGSNCHNTAVAGICHRPELMPLSP